MTIIDLPDGRRLDIAVSGPTDGLPLVIHHGTPGSAIPVRSHQRAAHERGLRLVRYSRPGYGSSTRRPGRTVADVADDVTAILDHLGATHCVTGGWSGGGPHALATAALLPERVHGALVVAGVGPYGEPELDFLDGMGEQNIHEFGAALRGADALRPHLEADAAALDKADAAGLIEGMDTVLPDVDRAVLTDEMGEDLAANFAEALRTGVDGWLDDDLAFVRPWGFTLAEIKRPVSLWQGGVDLMVPVAHGHWLGAHIPGVTTHFEPEHGHLSITAARLGQMLDELITTVPA